MPTPSSSAGSLSPRGPGTWGGGYSGPLGEHTARGHGEKGSRSMGMTGPQHTRLLQPCWRAMPTPTCREKQVWGKTHRAPAPSLPSPKKGPAAPVTGAPPIVPHTLPGSLYGLANSRLDLNHRHQHRGKLQFPSPKRIVCMQQIRKPRLREVNSLAQDHSRKAAGPDSDPQNHESRPRSPHTPSEANRRGAVLVEAAEEARLFPV